MDFERWSRALQRVRGENALGVLRKPEFLREFTCGAARNLALMIIVFPSPRVTRFVEIEQHEADLVRGARLETIFELHPAWSGRRRNRSQVKPRRRPLAPEVQSGVRKARVGVETRHACIYLIQPSKGSCCLKASTSHPFPSETQGIPIDYFFVRMSRRLSDARRDARRHCGTREMPFPADPEPMLRDSPDCTKDEQDITGDHHYCATSSCPWPLLPGEISGDGTRTTATRRSCPTD